ncbi:MAG TPA: glutaredoxin family protein [Lysobacter sp.]|nr:glutaredoxin family protein [Lysobacter sp.]
MRLTLYQRDDCHLCDLALGLLAEVRAPDFDSVFIDGDDALEERYGTRVPVLRDETRGVELEWPFDEEKLKRFLDL